MGSELHRELRTQYTGSGPRAGKENIVNSPRTRPKPCRRMWEYCKSMNHFFFFLIYVGCPGQLTRITTIPHGPLDILQAQEQVRHRGGDRRTHKGSNPGRGRNKSHELTTAVKPSSAGYTRELEPGHSGRAKPAKATELQAPWYPWTILASTYGCQSVCYTRIKFLS